MAVNEKVEMDNNEIATHSNSWFSFSWSWFSWSFSSASMLRAAEKKILSCLKTTYRGWFVDIGPVVGTSDKIWTISLNEDSPKTPILLLHGLGSGVALWCLNLDALSATRPVYAIDILGFGRSSRPTFSTNSHEAESQLVKSVEEWRREMNLENFILLGHSMGGFLAASYAISHPERVKHLILADPWGFPEKPANVSEKYNLPLWIRALAFVIQPFNVLWPVRLAGPFGQKLIERMRPDIIRKFSHFVDDVSVIPEYLYQCNAQTPSGEAAFRAMMAGFGWAKNPMLNRIDQLHKDIPMTILYGSRSWVENDPGEIISEKRSNSYVNIQFISGAGHHVYADKADIFNREVIKACSLTDEHKNLKALPSTEIKSSLATDVDNIEVEMKSSEATDADNIEVEIKPPEATDIKHVPNTKAPPSSRAS